LNIRRKIIVALGAGALTAPFASFAQQPAKIYRIGFLDIGSANSRADRVESFRAGLRELGYLENKNIVIEFRWADGKYERLAALAAELVQIKVDVLVAAGTPASIAAKQATSTIPIIAVGVGDPIASGLVTSLARPTGNVTGLALLSPEIMLKRFELLQETVPRAKQVAILVNPGNQAGAASFKAAEVAAKSLKLVLQKYEATNLDEIKRAFATITKKGAGGLVLPQDTIFTQHYAVIATLVETHRLPSFGPAEFAEAGGLIGLGALNNEISRRAATYVDKILKGAKPADIPVEQPTRFETVVNMKTAKALGVKIPNTVLVRATKVIE
jgi:putative ABC transport system substrate-binding protein